MRVCNIVFESGSLLGISFWDGNHVHCIDFFASLASYEMIHTLCRRRVSRRLSQPFNVNYRVPVQVPHYVEATASIRPAPPHRLDGVYSYDFVVEERGLTHILLGIRQLISCSHATTRQKSKSISSLSTTIQTKYIMASASTGHPVDPVDVSPLPPLQDSYTYHSAPYGSPEGEEWIMGIDEAGRGRESPAIFPWPS